jgi:predicted acyltransferase
MRWSDSLQKTLKRCFWLFFWGVLNYAVRDNGLSFELWNVLTQLSFTTLVAFLIHRWKPAYQLLTCVGLLLLTECLYRFTGIQGFDQPFTNQHNFGNWMDLVLMGKINGDGWVAINCIPTSVHTIGGLLAGKVLIEQGKPVKTLIAWGITTMALGYGLDWSGITPIIKRIATTSFTLSTLGWCLLALAAVYWWIDIRRHRKHLFFFTVVGMNSIFIYLFFEVVGHRWFNDYVGAVTKGLMSLAGIPKSAMSIITSLAIFGLEWGLCYFLYRKRIFFKL